MDWFKKPVKVKCQTMEQAGKLLNWLRYDSGLSEMHRQRYPITAVMARQYWDDPDELMYFEIEVPYHKYKKLREEFIERESFDEILQMRPIAEIVSEQDTL